MKNPSYRYGTYALITSFFLILHRSDVPSVY